MKLSLCIPVYNEEASVGKCVEAVVGYAKEVNESLGWETELVICDDGSTDKTRQVTEGYLEKSHPGFFSLKVIGYPDNKNRGKGSAVREAVKASSGDAVIYTDCDLAYGFAPIMPSVEMITNGADIDVVLGSRTMGEGGYGEYSFIRKLASRVYLRMISVISGFSYSDSQCGFKAFRGDVARKVFSVCTVNGFSFDLEAILIAIKAGYGIGEIPVKILNHGESKIHIFSDSFKMLRDVLKIRKKVRRLDTAKIEKRLD